MNTTDFIHDLAFDDLPAEVVGRAKLLFLDLVGVAVAGLSTDLSRIARAHAVRHMAAGEGGARLLFDGRRASPAGAAFAGASTIDSYDAHDGHALTKGHAGVAILPALLAIADERGGIAGRESLTSLVLGYEIATRAGIALHASVADYHTSGAWNALGCAAVAARLMGLDRDRTRHALGIAEYHGPRSQMMRVIAHPTMLKDGSGWGAFAGVSASYLAADGFTGAPAISVDAPEQAGLWGDLGTRWRIMEQYVKPHPVCRWAQPAIEAGLDLLREHCVAQAAIETVEVGTFAHAVALGTERPSSTEAAQYALGFPLAAALVRGRIGAAELSADGLADPHIAAMLGRITLREDAALSGRFPAERLAIVTVKLRDGRVLTSPVTAPRGNPDDFLSQDEIRAKFHELCGGLAMGRAARIEAAIEGLDRAVQPSRLMDLLLSPADTLEGRSTTVRASRVA